MIGTVSRKHFSENGRWIYSYPRSSYVCLIVCFSKVHPSARDDVLISHFSLRTKIVEIFMRQCLTNENNDLIVFAGGTIITNLMVPKTS